ncbi:MG2 domain-containing protein [Urechidicola sp. KH5]
MSNPYAYKDYILHHSKGPIATTGDISITLKQAITEFETGAILPNSYYSVSPKIKGELKVVNKQQLRFIPNTKLKSNTDYSFRLEINKLYKEIPKELSFYEFIVKTKEQDFRIETGSIQSYDDKWQYVSGIIQTADIVKLEEIKQIVTAFYLNKATIIKWDIISPSNFSFKIDSIERQPEDKMLTLAWDGAPIKVNKKGKQQLLVMGKDKFDLLEISVVQSPEQYVALSFSNALLKQQNFEGLVQIESQSSLSYVVDGNVLKVFPSSRIEGERLVTAHQGIKSMERIVTKKTSQKSILFEQLKPQIRLLSNGVILPNASNLHFNFQAVNLAAVDVHVVKIYEDNVLQFLQEYELGNSNDYNLNRVGRVVASRTVQLAKNNLEINDSWKTYALDVSELISADPGAIYRIELSAKKEYSMYNCQGSDTTFNFENISNYFEPTFTNKGDYAELENEEISYWNNESYNYNRSYYNWSEKDDPCTDSYYNYYQRKIKANILGSNIGLIVKSNENNEYHIAVNDLLTTNPIANATVRLFNFQQQEIAKTTTSNDGLAKIKLNSKAAFAIATKNNQITYLKVEDGNSLSVSTFEVNGKKIQKGIKGFIYGERGVWRPGDSIHLSVIINDFDNPIPSEHPLTLSVSDARGQQVYSNTKEKGDFGFSRFSIPTSSEAPTGNWNASVSLGGLSFSKNLKVETVKPNRLKIKLDFKEEYLVVDEALNGSLEVAWLHGAPAKNLRTAVQAKLVTTNASFKGYSNFIFNDPIKSFDSEEVEIFNEKVSNTGKASITSKLSIGQQAPGLLRAIFTTKAYEQGGDFSIDVFSKLYAPYKDFVGIKMPEPEQYNAYNTDENVNFEIVSIDTNGKPNAKKKLEVKVYKINWRWWWSSSYDDLASYVGSQYHLPVFEKTITTNSKGKAKFNVSVPDDEGGRYLIRVLDPESGHATGSTAYFYERWWDTPSSDDNSAATVLLFNADKESYKVGDEAIISFPSGSEGRALVSIENGSKVIQQQWVKTQKGQSTVKIPITAEMTPNVYVNISLLQPHETTENDLPIRLYGIIPLMVVDEKTKLTPEIEMPTELQPEKTYTMKVKEASGKPMTYTIAVVDEGLLDLTRFKTPDPWNSFYSKEALGVKTWDMYDEVIGAFSGNLKRAFAIGGDGSLEIQGAKKANRFKPVVKYLGPFNLGPNETKPHSITLPNYIGSVRTMVVAGDGKKAFGSAEETTKVKKPLMLLSSLPRKLSPGEKVTIPVTVFAMSDHVKNVTVSLKPSQGFKIIDAANKKVSFENPDERMVYFEVEVTDELGIANIEINASGNGEKAKHEIELNVLNPNPIVSKLVAVSLDGETSQEIPFSTFGVHGTNLAQIELSTLPPMNISKRLNYLIRYPHGCVEQTTSSAFPQLFLNDVVQLNPNQKAEIERNIEKAIKRLHKFQLINGGMSYWIGGSSVNEWGTNYAGHFMIEASQKGYQLPLMFLTNWLQYQKQAALNWSDSYNSSDLIQAYRLYTLALAGHPELGAMNRLREYSKLSNDAKWRLAAAYILAGQKEAATNLMNSAELQFENNKSNRYTYGSSLRNRALALETLVLLGSNNQMEEAETIAEILSTDRWLSTQSTAYCLIALSKMVSENGGNGIDAQFVLNGENANVNTEKSIAIETLNIKQGANTLDVINKGSNKFYARIVMSGKYPVGTDNAVNRNLGLEVIYSHLNGNRLEISKITQGTEFIAKIIVTNSNNYSVSDVALTQILPSGWEIINTRFSEDRSSTTNADYLDIRDDRTNFYFDLKPNEQRTFEVRLNASYLGKYYLYGAQGEAMYNNKVFARNKGQWIEVVK